jgi:hypothetical protein
MARTAREAVVGGGGRRALSRFERGSAKILRGERESVDKQDWKGEWTWAGVDVARPYLLIV